MPAEPTARAGTYGYLQMSGGQPVRYRACEVLRYVVGGDVPRGGVALVRSVLAEITAISGRRFAYQGLSHDFPQAHYGYSSTPPLWIGWSSLRQSDVWRSATKNDPDVVGLGGSVAIDNVYSTGYAMVLVGTPAARSSTAEAPQILRHEIGHLLGLDHVGHQDEVMYPSVGQPDYGPGDRHGLWVEGPRHDC